MTLLYSVHGDNDLTYGDWLVLTRGIGHDPDDLNGENFARFRQTPIVRLSNGYGNQGTIPQPQYYADFAQRCANYVRASTGCSRWIIGNEPNVKIERPEGQPVTPKMYAECYTLCRDAIKALPFHSGDQVLLAPIGPWNVDTKYAGNPSGDWVRYFDDVQFELPVGGCDGKALHAYTRGQTPTAVTSDARMDPPFEHYHSSFRVYLDWMAAILPRFQGLPCYITEFCVAGEEWKDLNTGCVQEAYREIDAWNRLHGDRPILCLTMYRWQYDRWEFWNKPQVIADFNAAVERGYSVPPGGVDPPPEEKMLKNPSFEDGWHEQDPQGILVLPDHWACEYQEGDDPYKRPEVKPNQEFATDGRFSIRAFPPEHSRGFYGIWQDVEVESDQWYRFSADVRVESEPPGKLGAFVGIQPWGGSIFHRQMIWGEEIVNSHEWTRVEVFAQAFGGRIRVAMGADNEYASRNNTTWWDNARLEPWECDGGTEPPEPPGPGVCEIDYDHIAQIVALTISEELDRRVWVAKVP